MAIPLFSVYSENSIGIGELPDIKLLVDWCKETQMSIIQLLPMNDVGFNFRPYDAQSAFALEPMYLSLDKLAEADLAPFKKELESLRERFPTGSNRVNYQIKQAKLELLWKVFKRNSNPSSAFSGYLEDCESWLNDYVLYKVIKEENSAKTWEDWDNRLKNREPRTLESFRNDNLERIKFHQWLQWQLYEQFKSVKAYAESKDVLLMGDLPFLVSRDSADVWSHQDYFKLGLFSGAPPDMYFAKGQRWGMPVYNWQNIARDDFYCIKERLRYAENFYDLFRVDHVIGVFRVWTIPISEPKENAGLNGRFDPQDESLWEAQGRKILSVMVSSTKMLPCGEDLGVVPECSYRVLEEFGIPGIDVQRWMKYWGTSYDFKAPQDYRKNAIAALSTHDSSILCAWWLYESGTVDGELFKRKCREAGVSFDLAGKGVFNLENSNHGRLRWKHKINNSDLLLKALNRTLAEAEDLVNLYKESHDERKKFWDYLDMGDKFGKNCAHDLVRLALEKISGASSIFSIQLIQDWLAIDCLYDCDFWQLRINFPGTMSEKNWSIVMDLSLEDILTLPVNNIIREINRRAGRM
jgi:4-alpha-glucanotransferase